MKRFLAVSAAVAGLFCGSCAQTLDVSAAASLKESFTKIAAYFESAHPGVHVQLNFAGSQRLASQIKLGSPTDVFASAGIEPFEALGVPRSDWRWFAQNRLVIVTPPGQRSVTSLKSMGAPMHIVIADQRVPVGHYSLLLLSAGEKQFGAGWRRHFEANVVSREDDVRAVLSKVELGEADAGVVYVTDAVAAGNRVRVVAIPSTLNPLASYPVAVMPGASHRELAKQFIHSLYEPAAQAALASAGFISPITPSATVQVGTVTLSWSKVAMMKTCDVTATDKGAKSMSYRGVDVRLILKSAGLPSANHPIVVRGADGYAVEIPGNLIQAGKVIVSRIGDKDWRLVVSGGKPNLWVRWIRSIAIR